MLAYGEGVKPCRTWGNTLGECWDELQIVSNLYVHVHVQPYQYIRLIYCTYRKEENISYMSNFDLQCTVNGLRKSKCRI